MPESLKDLRRRVRSISATKQITRAMEMVAAAKLRRAQEVLLAAKPYAEKLQELLSHLAASATVESHPLFQERNGNRKIMVVFSSDRGLCGGFNTNLLRMIENEMEKDSAADWQVYCIGKKGFEHFNRLDWPIIESKIDLSGRPESDFSRELTSDLLGRFESGQADSIYFGYPSFVSLALNTPKVEKFLHLDAAELAGGASESGEESNGHAGEVDYILEPSADHVFDSLVPRYLASKVYITMAELFTSEHSARMLAMNNATNNCEDLVDELTLRLNKARQQQITNDLIDIIGGAQAV